MQIKIDKNGDIILLDEFGQTIPCCIIDPSIIELRDKIIEVNDGRNI